MAKKNLTTIIQTLIYVTLVITTAYAAHEYGKMKLCKTFGGVYVPPQKGFQTTSQEGLVAARYIPSMCADIQTIPAPMPGKPCRICINMSYQDNYNLSYCETLGGEEIG